MNKSFAAIVFAFAALLIGACSGSDPQSQTDATVPFESSVASEPGAVADYLNSFDAAHLNGIDLLRGMAAGRERVTEDIEARFVRAVREDPSATQAKAILARIDDEAVVYLGYLYCSARDASLPIDSSVASVVDVVARANGRDPTTPATDDFIVSVTIVNLASGSLCPELYLDTRAFLDELTSGA